MGVVEEVRTGRSESRLLQPREFIESRKDVDAMVAPKIRVQANSNALALFLAPRATPVVKR